MGKNKIAYLALSLTLINNVISVASENNYKIVTISQEQNEMSSTKDEKLLMVK